MKALNIDFETMSSWRVWAGYPDNLLALGPLADDLAFNCVAAAVEFSGMLCSDLRAAIGSDNETMQEATMEWQATISDITSQDVRTGETSRLDLDL